MIKRTNDILINTYIFYDIENFIFKINEKINAHNLKSNKM